MRNRRILRFRRGAQRPPSSDARRFLVYQANSRIGTGDGLNWGIRGLYGEPAVAARGRLEADVRWSLRYKTVAAMEILGSAFDRNFAFETHFRKIADRMTFRIALPKGIAGLDWGGRSRRPWPYRGCLNRESPRIQPERACVRISRVSLSAIGHAHY